MLLFKYNNFITRLILKLAGIPITPTYSSKWIYFNTYINKIVGIGYDFDNLRALERHLYKRKEYLHVYTNIFSFISDIKLYYLNN